RDLGNVDSTRFGRSRIASPRSQVWGSASGMTGERTMSEPETLTVDINGCATRVGAGRVRADRRGGPCGRRYRRQLRGRLVGGGGGGDLAREGEAAGPDRA